MGDRSDVKQGTLALMILKTLQLMGPLHGYGIARRIEQTSGQQLAINYGTIYPALLNARGLAAALRSAAADAGVRVSVDVPASPNYPPEAAARVYFGCLEAFEYVGGQPVTITVREHERVLSFEVVEVEDGATCAATHASSDAALDRLRDRVDALGEQLDIRSELGRGLHLLGSIPLS